MPFTIDCSGAGQDIDSCKRGAERFRDKHPDLDWSVNACRDTGQLILNVVAPGRCSHPARVYPRLDMEDSVFTALEQILDSK